MKYGNHTLRFKWMCPVSILQLFWDLKTKTSFPSKRTRLRELSRKWKEVKEEKPTFTVWLLAEENKGRVSLDMVSLCHGVIFLYHNKNPMHLKPLLLRLFCSVSWCKWPFCCLCTCKCHEKIFSLGFVRASSELQHELSLILLMIKFHTTNTK